MTQWIETTQDVSGVIRMVSRPVEVTAVGQSEDLTLKAGRLQTMRGFGGCFNELGWRPLQQLAPADREAILRELFSPEELNFTFNRTPVGANDFAEKWYSYDETARDFALDEFSIENDLKTLIPYIKAAQKYQPQMSLFASPWSPPTWMKNPPVYNFGRIVTSPENLTAYAHYLLKYVQAYEQQGVVIDRLAVQNEVFADQKFPSCLWSSQDLKLFIRDYLGPLFAQEQPTTKIMLGTLNGPTDMTFTATGIVLDNYSRFVDNILLDQEARQYIDSIGYQWAGQHAIERTHTAWPEIELFQTESECGFGENAWDYAEYIFGLVNHYVRNGVSAYTYWNMILDDQVSTWGWQQNSLFTIKAGSHEVVKNPEYYVMRHFSHFVQPGARVVETAGHLCSMGLAFENPDGSTVVVIQNPLDDELALTCSTGSGAQGFTAKLAPRSFNTFVLD